ncbi:hypothetical protein BOTBODRAFT_145180 [Botryobasidium botryosum FD-172 SS1]|uniref:Uncharacterized protein n=1 Tax=Botryobasidium botryosum (strain FD-172 SS1) TaxID=930990 RepID=A0A067MV71_BOTB1|nr:hypothetical protein BOTBODRAFT_145180 [Botryobasidium botryosum FD-172 SS1]
MFRAETVMELKNQLDALLAAAKGMSAALDDLHTAPGKPISPPIHPLPQEARLINAIARLNHMRAAILPDSDVLTTLLKDINEGCNVIAPMNRLPNEILSCIFVLTQEPRGRWGSACAPQAIILSSICRRWREIATCTGALWDMFVLRNLSSYRIGELCTARSGGRDLKVIVKIGWDYIHSGSKEVESASHRWRDLTFDCLTPFMEIIPNMDVYMHEIMHRVQPSVTRLSLECGDRRNMDMVRLDSVLRITSQLRALQLHSLWLGGHPAHLEMTMGIPLVLKHLEELSMVDCCGTLCSYIFANLVAPQLRSFEIGCSYDGPMGPFFSRTTSISRLQLSYRQELPLIKALPLLINLETLVLGAASRRSNFACNPLYDILKRACPNLSELYFQLTYLPEPQNLKDFIDMRALMPGVLPIRTVSYNCLHNRGPTPEEIRDDIAYAKLYGS